MSETLGRRLRGALLFATLAGGLAAGSGLAVAGECPADKVIPAGTSKQVTEPKGVTDTVIASIDLAALNPALKDARFRMRRLVVQPGGIVPLHSHAERPANIYVISGVMIEHRDTCAVPIVHKAGEVVAEFGPLSHWWQNEGKKPAVLISSDVVNAGSRDDQVM